MAGQGSLCQRIFASRRPLSVASLLCAMFVLQLIIAPSVAAADGSGESIDVRLRCNWESKDARFWNVRLSVMDPETRLPCISEVENHSASDRTTGSLEVSSDGRTLSIHPRHAMTGGQVQLRIRGSRRAKLRMEILDDSRNDASRNDRSPVKQIPAQELSLAEIVERGTIDLDPTTTDDAAGSGERTTWTLTRVEGDELRIGNVRQVPVYESGDSA